MSKEPKDCHVERVLGPYEDKMLQKHQLRHQMPVDHAEEFVRMHRFIADI